MYEVARRAGYGGGAEVAHNHQLALGVPAGRGDYRAPHALRAAVQPEAARKEPVAETYLHEIPALDAEHGEASEHRARPCLHVLPRIRHDNRFSGGAARSVQAHDVLRIRREHSVGIGVAQVALLGEREF